MYKNINYKLFFFFKKSLFIYTYMSNKKWAELLEIKSFTPFSQTQDFTDSSGVGLESE